MTEIVVRLESGLDSDDRSWLDAHFHALSTRLNRMEHRMTEITDALTALDAKADHLGDDVVALRADVTTLLDKAAQAGVFTADERALVEQINEKFDGITNIVEATRDAAEPDEEPTPEEPAPAEGDEPTSDDEPTA